MHSFSQFLSIDERRAASETIDDTAADAIDGFERAKAVGIDETAMRRLRAPRSSVEGA